ncbi:MAG: dihydrofolate reductase family protein [Actinomycetes bacterium]|jgi:dihydrofolate reductase
MRKITVFMSMTLDGVIQSPGGPDEDPSGGFQHGGWAAPYFDSVMGEMAESNRTGVGAILLGRFTYEALYAYWPTAPQPNQFTDVLNNSPKYVASRTLSEPLPWMNSTLLQGDAADAVPKLKAEDGPDLVVLGSAGLVQTLLRHDLVDDWVLQIHPLVLGSGKRLFPDGAPTSTFTLADTVNTTTGVIIATYRRADQAVAGRHV